MTYRLHANKTKLYNLARYFWPDISPMRKTEYIKYFRVRDYALHFQAGNYYHRIFLSVCGGKVRLADTYSYTDDDGEEIKAREVHTITEDILRKFQLLEEVQG